MFNNSKIEKRCINENMTLMNALKMMDAMGYKSLIVIDDNEFFRGILSIGDIQRSIIKNNSLDNIISNVLRPNPRIARKDTTLEIIKTQMLKYRMEFMPIVDYENRIIQVYFWDELFITQTLPPKKKFDLPVVIMAGGIGTRLKPLTNVLPKPLIPIGKKSIIEEIFDRFGAHGCKRFYISLNYKADLIEFYLKNQELPFELFFFREETPRGTVGSLSLLTNKIQQTFFISNCDILIEQDYSEILDYHSGNKNEITIVAALKHFPITYGIIESGENGILIELKEKPELTLKTNSGMYILEPHLLKEIPKNVAFNITELIDQIVKRNGKVGVFPVSEKAWKDIGDWTEYKQHINEDSN